MQLEAPALAGGRFRFWGSWFAPFPAALCAGVAGEETIQVCASPAAQLAAAVAEPIQLGMTLAQLAEGFRFALAAVQVARSLLCAKPGIGGGNVQRIQHTGLDNVLA
jgi:hypothetical protein